MKSLSLTKPHAIIMVGIPGSGKTFFARKFSETFNAPRIAIEDIAPHAADHKAADMIAHTVLDEMVKTGLSLVVELDSATRASRHELSQKLREVGYVPLLVWVQIDQPTAKQRYERTTSKDKSDFDGQVRRFSPPHKQESPTVISGKHTYATQAKVVLKRLSAPREQATQQSSVPPRPAGRSITVG